ncbi:hypothetical protein ACFOZY_03195 [Chungangia koreensis]|uniref:Uncharacterized protein n=1 Tax=Chungangia koreensis TaxID=752657 RepID=A0ABV8X2T9_9LACT
MAIKTAAFIVEEKMCEIGMEVENLQGAEMLLSQIIEEMRNQPEIEAHSVRHGVTQIKLGALRTLIRDSINNVHSAKLEMSKEFSPVFDFVVKNAEEKETVEV